MAQMLMCATMVGALSGSPTPPQLAAMETVSKRLFGYYLKFSLCNQASACNYGGESLFQVEETQPSFCSITCNESLVFSKTLQRNGSWPDIDYNNKQRSTWTTADHLERTISLLRSYHCAYCDKQASSAPVLASVHSALDFWLQHDFRNPNWWCVYIHIYIN